jgi:hypothetical protein
MRAEIFWAAWDPICDFRRRLRARLRRQHRLAELERERRATLGLLLRAWARVSLATRALALSLPFGQNIFFTLRITWQRQALRAITWPVVPSGDLSLTEVPWDETPPERSEDEG